MLINEPKNFKIYPTEKPRALALLSGGLDSTLATKLIRSQGLEVEAVNFVTPFCSGKETCSTDKIGKTEGIKVHKIFLGEEFLKITVDPPHGYGSQMNPCVDCRILMLKKAKELAEEIGADFIITGEVLNERPFSQRKNIMLTIEKKADLEGKILRPLSAKLLPETDPEKKGIVDRDRLLDIQGRRRLPQIELASELGVTDYPNPSGGCLLTEPGFAERVREHLMHTGKLTLEDVALLRLGRHFRLDQAKVIVGRNEEENNKLLSIAKSCGIPYMEAADYNGPVTLYIGEERKELIRRAAAMTVRYSDAPKGRIAKVIYSDSTGRVSEIGTKGIRDQELETMRI